MASLQINPYRLEYAEGQRLDWPRALVFVKASTGQTGGAFNLLDVTVLAGFATPLQIHYAEDVAVFVLEGSLTVYWGDREMKAAAGSYLYQPRGMPFGFRVMGDSPARLLYLTVPAGFGQLVPECGPSANGQEAAAVAAQYKIEILGPLPE